MGHIDTSAAQTAHMLRWRHGSITTVLGVLEAHHARSDICRPVLTPARLRGVLARSLGVGCLV